MDHTDGINCKERDVDRAVCDYAADARPGKSVAICEASLGGCATDRVGTAFGHLALSMVSGWGSEAAIVRMRKPVVQPL